MVKETNAEIRARWGITDQDVRDAVERDTAASGVPYHVEDPAALARIAAIFAAPR